MRKTLRLGALVVALAGIALVYQQSRRQPAVHVATNPSPGTVQAETHYSPAENLERLDAEQLERAQRSVDVAMYAFTDKFLADELLRLARRGVVVRIYRDREQYEEEQRRAREHGDQSTTDLFRGEPNIHARIKASGRRDLMHLKAYLIDDALLRDGSANWSASGLKAQDNNAHFTNDPTQVRPFKNHFEEMWARPDNTEIQ